MGIEPKGSSPVRDPEPASVLAQDQAVYRRSGPAPSDRGYLGAVRVRPRPALLGAVLCSLWAAVPASAHKFEHPKILRLGVTDGELLLSVSYDVNPGDEARQLRGVFDRDGDGNLSAPEQAQVLDYLERTALLWLRLQVGGRPAELSKKQAQGSHVDAKVSSTDSVGISLLYQVAIPPAAPRLELELSDRDKDAAKVVPLTADLGPSWTVELATQGEWQPRLRSLERVFLTPKEGLRLVLLRHAETRTSTARIAPPGS